jgi:hypothetical protein
VRVSPPFGDVEGLSMDPCDRRRWPAQGQALDERDQLVAHAPRAAVASCAFGQASQALASVVGQPPLRGAQWHIRRGRRVAERRPTLDVGSEHLEAAHRLIPLVGRYAGEPEEAIHYNSST